MELTVEKASGQAAFVDPNSSDGPQKRATLRLVLDGYSGAGCFILCGEPRPHPAAQRRAPPRPPPPARRRGAAAPCRLPVLHCAAPAWPCGCAAVVTVLVRQGR